MPRRPTSSAAVQSAEKFLRVFIAHSDSEDHILPKNGAPRLNPSSLARVLSRTLSRSIPLSGTYSPYDGFCDMMPQHALARDGGTGVEGVSRGRLNKLVGQSFQEGMRKVLSRYQLCESI
jgi:hypothetical protein